MSLTEEHKVRGLEGKVLLKRLARKLLPVEVVDRPKVGFTVPLSPWFRGPLRDLLADTLLSPRCLGRGWYEPAAVRSAVDDHLSGRRDRARELWTLLTLELWHQAWIAGCGHAGDGNVHLGVFQSDPEVRARLMQGLFAAGMALGGTISGEHSIGTEKKKYVAAVEDPAKLDLMRRIKAAFDPAGVLNPAAIFD